MPIYEFRCGEGHVTEGMFSMSSRPESVTCPHCKADAPRIVSVTGRSMGAKPEHIRVAKEVGGTSAVIRCPDIVCRDCEHTWFDALDDTQSTPPCPKCASTNVYERIGVPGADYSNRAYPYYDRGLGCVVNSPGHRASICKERGLLPVDGDWDEDREIARIEKKDAELHEVYRDYADRLENHHAYRGYRIARDQGRMS